LYHIRPYSFSPPHSHYSLPLPLSSALSSHSACNAHRWSSLALSQNNVQRYSSEVQPQARATEHILDPAVFLTRLPPITPSFVRSLSNFSTCTGQTYINQVRIWPFLTSRSSSLHHHPTTRTQHIAHGHQAGSHPYVDTTSTPCKSARYMCNPLAKLPSVLALPSIFVTTKVSIAGCFDDVVRLRVPILVMR